MKMINSVLGIFTFEKEILSEDIENRIEERNTARKEKDYEKADRIRKNLLDMGIILEDTRDGTRWKKA